MAGWEKLIKAGDPATELTGTAYRILLVDSAGDVIELVHGAATKVLTSAGAAADPTWEVPAGGAPDAHKDSHDPEDGSDPLDAAAAGAIAPDDAAAEGTAHEFARADHTHGFACGTPTAVGTAAAEGTGTTSVRDDHVHDLGADCVDSGDLVADDVIDSEHIAADAVQAEHIDETATDIEFSQIILTPKSTGAGTTEGTVMYDSDDDHVYVYVV